MDNNTVKTVSCFSVPDMLLKQLCLQEPDYSPVKRTFLRLNTLGLNFPSSRSFWMKSGQFFWVI